MDVINKSMLAVIIASFLFTFLIFSLLPDKVAIHWNAAGKADGFSDKSPGIFILPGILVFLYFLFLVIPKIDPLNNNITSFHNSYGYIMLAIIVFIAYLHVLVLIYNLGHQFNMTIMMLPGFVFLFYLIGEMLKDAKRNWFVGVRTPWTLSSDTVWEKTHKLGAKLFKASAILVIGGILFPDFAIFFVIIPIILSSLYLTVYSYLEFKKESK